MRSLNELKDTIIFSKRFFALAISIAVILSMASCDSPVGFTEAQPTNAPDLKSLPTAYHGIYICQSDSSLVIVEDQLIYTEITEIAIIPMSYIAEREECTIVNDTLYIEGKRECAKVTYPKEGFITAANITKDTIFRLTPYQKARLYKGNLILSQVTENNLWTIAILELDGDSGIRYRAIIDDSDLEALSTITPMTRVATNSSRYPQYKVTPRQVELDKLFENKRIFIDCDYFSRVNIIK